MSKMAKRKKAAVKQPKWNIQDEELFDGDIIITDPTYIGGWEEVTDSLSGLESQTYYGDWGCTVFQMPDRVHGKKNEIGQFCADGGRVCVYHKADILAKFPKFKKWQEDHPWCVAEIDGFKGVVKLVTRQERVRTNIKENGKYVWYTHTELRIRGTGEKDGKPFEFETVQTSL